MVYIKYIYNINNSKIDLSLAEFDLNIRHLRPPDLFLKKFNLNIDYLQCISRSYSYSMKAYPLGLPSILLCVTTIYLNLTNLNKYY